MKCFSLELIQRDPVSREISVKTTVYVVRGGLLEKLSGRVRSFEERDILDLERDLSVAGITYNDMSHGEVRVQVEEMDLPPGSKVVKVIDVSDLRGSGRGRYFIALETAEAGERVLYSSHRALRHGEAELKSLARVLGVSEKALGFLAKSG